MTTPENPRIDLRPRPSDRSLPRGVTAHCEYQVYDHEHDAWVKYQEFLYRTSIGVAHICLGPGKSLRTGIDTAIRLLQDDKQPYLSENGCYGVANSLKNHDDLASASPLSLVLARAGAYTERSVGRILDVFTGGGLFPPSRLHRLMADRPALALPYQPYKADSYRRLKPAYVPPEIKMKYVTPTGTTRNELLLAGKIVNRWSDDFYAKVRADLDYTLWITEGEKKGMCLSMLPLLLGAKMDVVSVPGVWMWGKKQPDGSWRLAPELAAYKFCEGEKRRPVGIIFDGDSWRNPRVADALLRLCQALRVAGAMVFVGVIPPGKDQKGVDDFTLKYCVTEEGFDFEPLLNLLDRAVYVDRDYAVTYPSPEVLCRLKTLVEQADVFEEQREELISQPFSSVDPGVVDTLVGALGTVLDPESSDLNGGRFLHMFRQLPIEKQTQQWCTWLDTNPFQVEIDRMLDRYIPGVFRGKAALNPKISLGRVQRENLSEADIKRKLSL